MNMDLIPEILYEDKHIVICVKPSGYLSEPADGKGFPDLLSNYLGVQISTVHRLDKIVGGVMVFAKTKIAASKLTQMVANHEVQKEYLAILRGVPAEASATLEDLLFRDSSKNKTYVVKRMRKGVRKASLDYTLLGVQNEKSLVRVHLHTGRTHQIRVQFASRKLPLLGDIRYGSKDPNCEAALWSWRLCFAHPITGKIIDIKKLPPMEYPWQQFEENMPSAE